MSIWTPSIEVQSSRGPREVQLKTEHLKARRVFLSGAIDSNMAEDVISQLFYLDDGEQPIYVIINSPGGSVSDGLMIYDTLQGMMSPVEFYCIGTAASMGALLLASGKKGHRHIFPHAKTMIHEPLISSGVGGSATSIGRIADSIMETKKVLNKLLAKHTGKTLKAIEKATSYDNYMNAEESVNFGLCDDIVLRIGGDNHENT